jgi:hypothetical protein
VRPAAKPFVQHAPHQAVGQVERIVEAVDQREDLAGVGGAAPQERDGQVG